MTDSKVRLSHHGKDYEFGVGSLERQGDRVRVVLTHGDDTQGHFLINEQMGRVKTVSGGSGSEIRVRLEKERRRYHIFAARRGGDDVSGHAMDEPEEALSGEYEGAEVAGHGVDDVEIAELGLAAAAAWLMLAEDDTARGEGVLPAIG